ncbi:MAG: TatD family hydrolase [Clostridia bacterium]|nr:TatD family hydrolase [Clostridia bacterium]
MIAYPDEIKLTRQLIFDSHAHYDDEKFNGIRDELLNALPKYGVSFAVTCSVDGKSSENSNKIAEKYPYIYSAVGIHPENLDSNTPLSVIKKLSQFCKCVAIGEIGLDYYYNSDNKIEQMDIFEKQLVLANELNLPVIVHDREAHSDTLELLKKHKPKGVVHCFSGSSEMAKEIINIGMYIGVGGVITFKNSRKLPEVLTTIPTDKLLVETDCPYLAPEPYRGQLNHSGFITLTAKKIAQILNLSFEEVLTITSNNAKKLFSIK